MSLQEILLGQIPEAIYFALFLILTKRLKTKRLLFTVMMVAEYVFLFNALAYNIWAHILFFILAYIQLKLLYKEECQITDIFTLGIASIIMIGISAIVYGLTMLTVKNLVIGALVQKCLLFLFLFVFRNKLYKIQKLYIKLWNRPKHNTNKIKSTTFRALNLVIFNFSFVIINVGVLLTYILGRR